MRYRRYDTHLAGGAAVGSAVGVAVGWAVGLAVMGGWAVWWSESEKPVEEWPVGLVQEKIIQKAAVLLSLCLVEGHVGVAGRAVRLGGDLTG